MDSTYQSVAIVRSNQYWLCLGNESNTIAKFFDTGFACDENLLTYVDNIMISTSITLFCIFFCSCCVQEHESKVPAGSASANFSQPDKIYISKITPTVG